jgi:hypothetical protein
LLTDIFIKNNLENSFQANITPNLHETQTEFYLFLVTVHHVILKGHRIIFNEHCGLHYCIFREMERKGRRGQMGRNEDQEFYDT